MALLLGVEGQRSRLFMRCGSGRHLHLRLRSAIRVAEVDLPSLITRRGQKAVPAAEGES